jgi:ABC-type sugar transport system permease subunit
MMNQFQLYILLPMIGAYIPDKVIEFITGMSFTLVSFSFIPIVNIPLIKDAIDLLSYTQRNSYYNDIGMGSGSAIANNVFLILVILFLVGLQ